MTTLLTLLSFWAMAFSCLLGNAMAAEPVPRGELTEVTNYGSNLTGTRMFLYVPQNVTDNPAIVVSLHWCGGTAQDYFQSSHWANNAVQHGFIVVYPQSQTRDQCWDVSSKKTLTHGGGGSSNSIVNMVDFVAKQYGADRSRVYATGISSGAMMTNVLAAAYPDVFAAVIAYAGVPAGCFMSADNIPDFWNVTCSSGQSIYTQQEWANVVFNMYPGYKGPRPNVQVYHGDKDTTLDVQNYYETIKQWTGVFGYSETPESNSTGLLSYTKFVFGEKFQTSLGANVDHWIDVFPDDDLKWFGFLES